jgi:hypothetical protein
MIPQLPRSLEENLIPMVMSNKLGTNTHPVTNPIQTRLELIRPKELKSSILAPLLPHKPLRLQTRTPIDTSPASPSAARNNTHRAIVRHFDAAILEQVDPGFLLGHRQLQRGVVVGLVYYEDAMAGFGEGFGADRATAAGADDDDVCFDGLGGRAGWELEEFILVNRTGFVVEGNLGEAR